jgi:hypothetical protein
MKKRNDAQTPGDSAIENQVTNVTNFTPMADTPCEYCDWPFVYAFNHEKAKTIPARWVGNGGLIKDRRAEGYCRLEIHPVCHTEEEYLEELNEGGANRVMSYHMPYIHLRTRIDGMKNHAGGSDFDEQFYIKFCPMCGRSLFNRYPCCNK